MATKKKSPSTSATKANESSPTTRILVYSFTALSIVFVMTAYYYYGP